MIGHKELLGLFTPEKEGALQALKAFADTYDSKYLNLGTDRRDNLNTLFNYPKDIRKAIYTTNAIESVHRVIRKIINKRKLFPTDDYAKKVVYLSI